MYEETAPLYSKKYGRPAIDPVVIVKYLLVGFLYGIPSERQTSAASRPTSLCAGTASTSSTAYRPQQLSALRRRKPSFRKVFRRLFEEVVGSASKKGLVSGERPGRIRPTSEPTPPVCVGRTGGGRGGGRRLPGAAGRLQEALRNLSGEPESAGKSGQSRSNGEQLLLY